MLMMMVMVMFLEAALDIFQLKIDHVLLTATVGQLVAVQVLITEPVAAERFCGQVVPRLDRFHGGVASVVSSVRRRRLRLDRMLAGRRLSGARGYGGGHRIVVPVQRVRAQRRRVRSRAVLGQAVLVSSHVDATGRRRALAYPLVRSVPVVNQVTITVLLHVVPRRVPTFLVSFPTVRALRFTFCKHTCNTRPIVRIR